MTSIPNLPNVPNTWDKLLFLIGIGLIYFNQGNNWFTLLGIFFLGIGIIIGLGYPLALLLITEPNDDSADRIAQYWVKKYIIGSGIILSVILFVVGLILFGIIKI